MCAELDLRAIPQRLGLIWAQARASEDSGLAVIGKNGVMPWHLPEDLAWFKKLTLDHPVIMGRRTWESLPERFRPLPGRSNIVVTANAKAATDPVYAGAAVVHTTEDALQLCEGAPTWVIGGSSLYRAFLDCADTVARTIIDTEISGADTFAPALANENWTQIWQSELRTSRTGLNYRFELHTRRTQEEGKR